MLYNAQFSKLRLALVLLFAILPIIILFTQGVVKSVKSTRPLIYMSLLWTLYLSIWSFSNFDDLLQGSLDGANVEMLTPFLYASSIYMISVIYKYDLTRLRKVIFQFLIIYSLFLIFDVIYRIILEPVCFMNYSCRWQAKTVGYYSTTNALATSLVVILLSLYQVTKKYYFVKTVLTIVLVTTMARAAIITYIFCRLLQKYGEYSLKARLALLFISVNFSAIFIYLDPLLLLHDGSFLSKIAFISASFSLFQNSELYQILFGFGALFEQITTALGVNGWSPHIPILKSFMYFGLVGVILYCCTILAIMKISKELLIPTIGYLIIGLAGAPIFFPTFLAVYAIIRSFSEVDVLEYKGIN